MSFNRTHSRAVIDLLTGHNILRWHLYLLVLQDSPLCRKCGVMEKTSAHILCEWETLASLRHAYLGSFFLEPKDIQSISLGANWSFSKASGLPWLDMRHKGLALRPRCIGAVGPWTLDIFTHTHTQLHQTLTYLFIYATMQWSLLRLIVRSGLDVPTFATRRLHACHHARALSSRK